MTVTLDIPNVIFTEAFQTYPGQLVYPTVLIALISLSFNFLGDRLRDLLDTHTRGQS